MQYNLINNGIFSGSGDHTFTWTELESLHDNNTTSSGVTVSGVNNLIVDLSQRIKVDGMRLYASDLTKSSDIYFYYKNETNDEYTLLSTNVSAFYYTTINNPSAPRYIKVTISGVSAELYEFQILNNDVIVAFGIDGQQYAEYLEDTPIGEDGNPQAIAIYNNDTGSMSADAYVCADYTATSGDNYVKISSSENGTYYTIEDGVILEDNELNSKYIWDMGEYNNTILDNDEIIIGDVSCQLGEVPLITNDNSFNTAENCFAYDSINKKVYAIGSDGILKLWEYIYTNDTWDYIGEINPGCSNHSLKATMCYLNDKIYCLTDGNQTFGYYDLNGPIDNWTTLSGHPVAETGSGPRRNIVSDDNRYIYCVDYQYGAITKRLYRYDTTTSGWSSLDNGYSSSATHCYQSRFHMCYDVDRDYIYLNVGNRGSDWYIQRYDVSTNSWNTTYLDLNSMGFSAGNGSAMAMAYYNDDLWIMNYPETSTIKRYNMADVTLYTYTNSDLCIDSYVSCLYSNYMVATDASVFIGGIDNNRDKLYQYIYSFAGGTYTTPIIGLDNKYNSSYITINHDGRVSVSDSEIDSIEVKSSDVEPLVIDEIFWIVYDTQFRIYKYVVYDGDATEPYFSPSNNYGSSFSVAVNRRNGNISIIQDYFYGSWVRVYNYSGTMLYNGGNRDTCAGVDFVHFDKSGGVWFSDFGNRLYHYDYELNELFSDTSVDIYDFAAEMDGDGVWYTNSTDNTLIHKDTIGTLLHTIPLSAPRAICGTLDNGCWVIDNTDGKVYRYNFNGSRVKTVTMERTATRMSTDMMDGFWYINGNYIYHVDSNGTEDISVYVDQPKWVNGGYNGCIVSSTVHDTIKYIDKASGSITRSAGPVAYGGPAAMFSFRYEDYIEFHDTTNFIPISYDPVWSTGGSLEWKTVSKNGYFLPKCKYHQFRITLRDLSSEDAALKKVILAPAVKVEDIPSGQSKNMYIKSDIPIGVDPDDYETKLRAWWNVEA